MNFISIPFILLFVFLLFFIWIVSRTKTNDSVLTGSLIIASILFYVWDGPNDFLVLFGYVCFNYLGGLLLNRVNRLPFHRRWVLFFIILVDLGGLGYFKYSNFISDIFIQLGVSQNGLPVFLTTSKLMPLGISFFTFQAMSYCIDIYFNRITPSRFLDFFLYVIFFPKINSGPIMRAGEFLSSLKKRISMSWKIVNESVYLIISGVFLKVVCADSVAIVVNKLWDSGIDQESHAIDLLIIAIYFSIQVFCDFAGYTNIARGIALLIGFRMPINFIRPYSAVSFTKFWQNWHISLTDWIRVYLFYPLERISRNRIWLYLTPILVMVLVGFWHGANWTYVVWGLLFGIGMSIERITGLNRADVSLWKKIPWAMITQITVIVGWIFFRSSTVLQGWFFIQNIIHGLTTTGYFLPTREVLEVVFPSIFYWSMATDGSIYNLIYPALIDLLPVITVVAIHLPTIWKEQQKKDKNVMDIGVRKTILAGIMLFFCFAAYSGTPSMFLYFQF